MAAIEEAPAVAERPEGRISRFLKSGWLAVAGMLLAGSAIAEAPVLSAAETVPALVIGLGAFAIGLTNAERQP